MFGNLSEALHNVRYNLGKYRRPCSKQVILTFESDVISIVPKRKVSGGRT